MKYCIHCGSELEDEDKFCVHCGLSQSSAPEPGCQQEAVGQTSVSHLFPPRQARKPVNRAVIVLSVALAAALVVIVCLVLFMRPSSDEGRHPLPMLHRSSRLVIPTVTHLLMTLRVLIPLLLQEGGLFDTD